jgi:hypothetical protein
MHAVGMGVVHYMICVYVIETGSLTIAVKVSGSLHRTSLQFTINVSLFCYFLLRSL